eukprot:scaffold208180_cov77-Cyclotella_meneghiniana.AAC.1
MLILVYWDAARHARIEVVPGTVCVSITIPTMRCEKQLAMLTNYPERKATSVINESYQRRRRRTSAQLNSSNLREKQEPPSHHHEPQANILSKAKSNRQIIDMPSRLHLLSCTITCAPDSVNANDQHPQQS